MGKIKACCGHYIDGRIAYDILIEEPDGVSSLLVCGECFIKNWEGSLYLLHYKRVRY
jgi:hypothetical protein